MLLTDVDLINEFKRRNLLDSKTLDKLLLDQKITNLQAQQAELERAIAKAVAEKMST